LELGQILNADLIHAAKEISRGKYFDILLIFVKRNSLYYLFGLAKDIVDGPPTLYKFKSELVQDLFGSIKHLFLSNAVL
jgi:hypothetical protein